MDSINWKNHWEATLSQLTPEDLATLQGPANLSDFFEAFITKRDSDAIFDRIGKDAPFVLDASTLDGPAWKSLKEAAATKPSLLTLLEAFETDVRSADANHDSFLTNAESMDFVEHNRDRWPLLNNFRQSAYEMLEGIPYTAVPKLSETEIKQYYQKTTQLRNAFLEDWTKKKTPTDEQVTQLYGAFELVDEPALLDFQTRLNETADNSALTLDEKRALHILGSLPMDGNRLDVSKDTPLQPFVPDEIEALINALAEAAEDNETFFGMKLVTSESAVEKVAADCEKLEISEECQTNLNQAAESEAGVLPVGLLINRIQAGVLSDGEIKALTEWGCDKHVIARSGIAAFSNNARTPLYWLTWGYLSDKYLLYPLYQKKFQGPRRKFFEKRLAELCGDQKPNTDEALKKFDQFRRELAANRPRLERYLRTAVVYAAYWFANQAKYVNGPIVMSESLDKVTDLAVLVALDYLITQQFFTQFAMDALDNGKFSELCKDESGSASQAKAAGQSSAASAGGETAQMTRPETKVELPAIANQKWLARASEASVAEAASDFARLVMPGTWPLHASPGYEKQAANILETKIIWLPTNLKAVFVNELRKHEGIEFLGAQENYIADQETLDFKKTTNLLTAIFARHFHTQEMQAKVFNLVPQLTTPREIAEEIYFITSTGRNPAQVPYLMQNVLAQNWQGKVETALEQYVFPGSELKYFDKADNRFASAAPKLEALLSQDDALPFRMTLSWLRREVFVPTEADKTGEGNFWRNAGYAWNEKSAGEIIGTGVYLVICYAVFRGMGAGVAVESRAAATGAEIEAAAGTYESVLPKILELTPPMGRATIPAARPALRLVK